MMRGHLLLIAALALSTAPVAGQTPAPTAVRVSIDTAALVRYVSILADDSMAGRDTPSPGLDRAARYVSEQFTKAGLKPVGGDTGLEYLYRVPPQLDFLRTQLVFQASGKEAVASFGRTALLEGKGVPSKPTRGGILLVAGPHTLASLDSVAKRGKVVLYVPPAESALSPGQWVEIQYRLRPGNRGLVVMSDRDSALFARQVQGRQRKSSVEPADHFSTPFWVVHVRPQAVSGLSELLAASGIDVAQLRRATTPIIREVAAEIVFQPQFLQPLDRRPKVPNVIGRLDGSDPQRRKEYVIITAHMDHVGIDATRSDSIANGVNDNASGVAGLLALVKAFSELPVRPRRSLLFVASSGGAKDLWGSRAVAAMLREAAEWSIVRPASVLNLDMIGRLRGDTLAVAGMGDIQWPTSPAWIAAAHPELALTVVDPGTLLEPTSDHFAYVEERIPSLSFLNGSHDAGSAFDDMPGQVNAEQEARIITLAFHVAFDIANALTNPLWTAASRQRLFGAQNNNP